MSYYKQASRRGVEQSVARRAHNPEVVGSSPSPATIKNSTHTSGCFFLCLRESVINEWHIGYEHDERCSLGICCERILWMKKRARNRAVVEKIKEKRKPDNFFGKPQPGTKGDNPEVVGSSPSPATIKKNTHNSGCFFYACEKTCMSEIGYEHDERCSPWIYCERILWMKKRARNRAVVEKIKEK